MDVLSKDDLRKLIEERDQNCISINLPTLRKGSETQQNAIRFKNLLRDAESELQKRELRPAEVDALLKPARELLEDFEFWQHQSEGLAFFRSSGNIYFYRLPLKLQELVIVADRFHVKPLLSILRGEGEFFVLALDLNEVKLFRGSKYELVELDLENMPRSLAEALQYDDPERQLQYHTGSSRTDRAAIFHGHGKGVDIDDAEHKKNILRFFQQLDTGMSEHLGDHNAPLVLAGVGYLLPLYRNANSYPHLVEAGITHNPHELSEEQLHQRAREIVRPIWQQGELKAAEKYKQLRDSPQTSSQVEEIVIASQNQRVEQLFVRQDCQIWGSFDPAEQRVVIHEKQEAGDGDLLDLAAAHTFINGGTVTVAERDQMPDDSEIAAIFRY